MNKQKEEIRNQLVEQYMGKREQMEKILLTQKLVLIDSTVSAKVKEEEKLELLIQILEDGIKNLTEQINSLLDMDLSQVKSLNRAVAVNLPQILKVKTYFK